LITVCAPPCVARFCLSDPGVLANRGRSPNSPGLCAARAGGAAKAARIGGFPQAASRALAGGASLVACCGSDEFSPEVEIAGAEKPPIPSGFWGSALIQVRRTWIC